MSLTSREKKNRPVCGISLDILGPFVGSARLWESAPFVGLTLFVSLTYIPGKKKFCTLGSLGKFYLNLEWRHLILYIVV